MSTCNLLETTHNILLQQSRKRDVCLYTTTFDDYVQVFKQSSLYMEYLKGGQLKQGPNRNELYLCKITQFGNPLQMTTIVTKYTSNSSYNQRHCIWKVKKFSNHIKDAQIFPQCQKNICIGMSAINFLIKSPLLFVLIVDQMYIVVSPLVMQDVPLCFHAQC